MRSNKVEALPAVPQFREWLNELRRAIAAASGRPQLAFKWVLEVGEQGVSFDSLSNSGDFEE